MPLTEVQQVDVTVDGAANISFSFTQTTQNNLLVVGIVADVLMSTPTGWTRDAAHAYQGGNADVGIFYRLAPSGTYTSQTFTGNSGDKVGVFWEFSGNATADVLDGKAASATNAFATGTTGTTVQADELAVAVIGASAAGSDTVGTFSAWTNSFIEEADLQSPAQAGQTEVGGGFSSRALDATGTFSTAATYSGTAGHATGGMIATFKASTGDVTATPAVIAVSVALPQASAQTLTTASPAVTAATVALPQSAVSVGAVPAPVAATVAFPQPAVSVQAVPAVVPVAVSFGQANPVIAGDATVTPAVIAATTAFAAAAAAVGASPAVLSVTAALPQPAVSIGAVPAVVPVTVAFPAASPLAGDVTVTPAAFTVTAALGQPTLLFDFAVTPAVTAVTVALPTPTILTPPAALFFMTPFRDRFVPYADPRYPDTMTQPLLSLRSTTPRPINLFVWPDGSVREEQPPGDPDIPGWSRRVYYGGAIYRLTQAEVDELTASGWEDYIVADPSVLPLP